MTTLSLCMITKNEEKNIKRCLDSVKDIVDEIIVVDTGSTDNTVEIAKSYGAKLYSQPWNNDFSEARNKSLEYATMDWIIVLDADEELPKEEGLKLKKIISNTKSEALFIRLENFISKQSLGDAIVLRVFRNNPMYRFRGKMHEQVIFSIEEISGKNCIEPTDIKILHYGYDPEVTNIEIKKKRNLQILESYPEEDRDGYFYYSLANEYSRIKYPEKAIQLYKKSIEVSNLEDVNSMPSYAPYLIVNLSRSLFSLNKFKEAIEVLEKYEQIYPEFRDLYFLHSLYLSECGKMSIAKDKLLSFLSCDYGHYIFPDSNFENTYNMGTMLKNLRKNSIANKEENFLSVLFIGDTYDDTLLKSIKSVNEIADEVIVTMRPSCLINRDVINNLYAKPVIILGDDPKDLFMLGLKECSGKYVLIMKSRELFQKELLQNLIDFLHQTNDDFMNILIKNATTNEQSAEFRLFRNSDEVKDVFNFDEFIELSNKKQINTYDISIIRL